MISDVLHIIRNVTEEQKLSKTRDCKCPRSLSEDIPGLAEFCEFSQELYYSVCEWLIVHVTAALGAPDNSWSKICSTYTFATKNKL